MKKFTIIILINSFLLTKVSSQNYTEVLGRPTDSAITLNILFNQSVNVYWEYGTSPGNYSIITPIYKTIADTPLEVDFINLLPDTKYYYRTKYLANTSTGNYISGAEHFFKRKENQLQHFHLLLKQIHIWIVILIQMLIS